MYFVKMISCSNGHYATNAVGRAQLCLTTVELNYTDIDYFSPNDISSNKIKNLLWCKCLLMWQLLSKAATWCLHELKGHLSYLSCQCPPGKPLSCSYMFLLRGVLLLHSFGTQSELSKAVSRNVLKCHTVCFVYWFWMFPIYRGSSDSTVSLLFNFSSLLLMQLGFSDYWAHCLYKM